MYLFRFEDHLLTHEVRMRRGENLLTYTAVSFYPFFFFFPLVS